MDPLSISASIVALLQLSGTVVQYVHDVKGASEDRRRLLVEIKAVENLLFTLDDTVKASQLKGEFKGIVKMLIIPNGPLDLFREALERLKSRLAGAGKVRKALKWPFDKAEVSDLLSTLEGLKSSFTLAIGIDHS